MGTTKYNYIDIHTHSWANRHTVTEVYNLLSTNIDEIAIENNKYYTVGIHPWHVNSEFIIEKIKKVCERSNVLAIGEIGIDRAIDIPIEKQTDYFIKQLQLAITLNKPVVIHSVKAYSDVLAVLKKTKPIIPIIFHDYNDTFQTYKQLIKYNTYFSFGFRLMNITSKAYRTFKKIDIERIFLETDTYILSIEEVYNKAAKIRGIETEDLLKQCFLNFNNCFTRL